MEVRTTLVLDQEEYLSLKKRSDELNMSVSRFMRYLFNTYGERKLNRSRNKKQYRISGSIKSRDLKKVLRDAPDYSHIKTFGPLDANTKFDGMKDGVYTTKQGDVRRHSLAGGGYCYSRIRYFNPETNESVKHNYKKMYPHEIYFYGSKGSAIAAILYGESFDYSLQSFKNILGIDEE